MNLFKMSKLQREIVYKKSWEGKLEPDWEQTAKMEKRKALKEAKKITTIGGLVQIIGNLAETTLPDVPHLLTIPGARRLDNIPRFNQELLKIPWKLPLENEEARKLQYMTLFSETDRELQVPQGHWQEDTSESPPNSAGIRSSMGTPHRDPNKPKMSIADYKAMKQTGIRPPPKQFASTPEIKPSQNPARNSNNASNTTSMARALSYEGSSNGAIQKNGVALPSANKAEQQGGKTNSEKHGNSITSNPIKAPAITNGTNGHTEHKSRETLKGRDVNMPQNKSTRTSLPSKEPVRHSLPPRPQSPRRYPSENKNHKRPLEAEEQSHIDKRAKIDRTSSPGAQRAAASKPDAHSSKTKAPPSNLGRSDDHAPRSSKAPNETKQNKFSKTDKPLHNLPPLLSPLPADLTDPSTFDSPKLNEPKATPSNASARARPAAASSSSKKLPSKAVSPRSPNLATTPPRSSPFSLPALLSPTLPDIVEQELAKAMKRETEKQTPDSRQEKPGLLTVEARHKEARKPDAPGVARKSTGGAIVGHPPKKSASSTPIQKPREVSKGEGQSLIVKLPYSKKRAQTVERLVRLSPRPSTEFLKLEALRKKEGSEAMMAYGSEKKNSSDSDSEVPLAARNNKPISKKRPGNALPAKPELATKRGKAPDNLDVAVSRKTVPASLKSPVLSAPPQKNLLATPKNSDVTRATAMRKVDSNDGSVHTPQALNTTTSTPASVEQPKINGERPHTNTMSPEASIDYAKSLKRKSDKYLKSQEAVPIEKRKLGSMIGLESLCLYMRCYGRYKYCGNWEDLVKLGGFFTHSCKDIPVLHAVSLQLTAVGLEEVVRGYANQRMSDGETKEGWKKDAHWYSKIREFSAMRDQTWKQCNSHSRYLKDLPLSGPLLNCGPWTNIGEVTSFAMEVCAAFERVEKSGWQKDVDF